MSMDSNALKQALITTLHSRFGCQPSEASPALLFQASALVLQSYLQAKHAAPPGPEVRQVHYLSMEFLLGRSLEKTAWNLQLLPALSQAVESLGFSWGKVLEAEPDAGLGNGGLGRLAACYLDSMATLGIPATGYSICYSQGFFRQKIADGRQEELPDSWLDPGGIWLTSPAGEPVTISFGGTVSERWQTDRLHISMQQDTKLLAVPADFLVSGYHTEQVGTLRLWTAKAPHGAAPEVQAMAADICRCLYPNDSNDEGKRLRLRQQYFFVSATVQSIIRAHKAKYGTLRNFHKLHVIQINDTHPALAIPELMRILLDEEGYGWKSAWEITTQTVAYTNHTVMAEALERWPQHLLAPLLPRVFQIICEINRRLLGQISARFPHDSSKLQEMAIVQNGEVRMANLCVAACFAVNGVSPLHTRILKETVFPSAAQMTPERFHNISNGVDHRRWLAQINPRLHGLICSLTGSDRYLLQPERLEELNRFASDPSVLNELGRIKKENKRDFAVFAQREYGIRLNPDAIFDVQIKRLHEYKRQLLNVLHIMSLYHQIQQNPSLDLVPQTFLFGAKAAPSYDTAKEIIRLICSLSQTINRDPRCKDKLQVFFLENYRVSLAERLIPGAELSEQISTAGTEASGTGNMKLMMNGALTIGTLDGANVALYDAVGQENCFRFGLTAEEVARKKQQGYHPQAFYQNSQTLPWILHQLRTGWEAGQPFDTLADRLLTDRFGPADQYLLLADFDSYAAAHQTAANTYRSPRKWNQMSLRNIAQSGIFAADSSIRAYAKTIWHIPY